MIKLCKIRRLTGTLRGGFTLVELLVVIAIVGIVASLTAPAVQATRETARRIQCQNHLKQIGLAFHQHHETFGFFPSGGWRWNTPPTYEHGAPQVGGAQRAGWGFQVLPFLEARAAYDAGAETAVGTPIPTMFCPSRRSPQTVQMQDIYEPPLTGTLIRHALCDYAASNRDGTGPVQRFKPLRFADIRDGASNTLLVGEKRLNKTFLGQPQDDDNEGYTAGWNEDTIRRTDQSPAPDYAAPKGDGGKLFGGPHPGTVQFVFVDGSVQSIAYSIDSDMFESMGHRHDGFP